MRILILCTGNSCRSQMAEGFLKSFDARLEVFSAGTHPAPIANPNAVTVMAEMGIDISKNKPTNVDRYVADPFDYVITVCDNAREVCPYFTGNVSHRLHMGFDDPAEATGTPDEVKVIYRQVRDDIREQFYSFYNEKLKPEMAEKIMSLPTGEQHDEKKDCGCEGNCCPPKKKNPLRMILFAVIILAALGIVGFKLFHHQAPAAAKGACCPPGSSVSCDTTIKVSCDTTKSSSCCPKKQ